MGHSSVGDSTPKQVASTTFIHRRIIKNRLIATLITIAGWMVLLTLGILLWHLISQVWPLTETPDVDFNESFVLPKNEQTLYVGDVINGGSLVTLDQDCRLNLYTVGDVANAKELLKTRVIPTLCSDSVRVSAFSGSLYLAKLSQSGILRIEQFIQGQRQFRRRLETSFAVADENSSINIDSFDFHLSDDFVMVALKSKTSTAIHVVDRRTNATIHKQEVDAATDISLLPRIGQYVYTQGASFHSIDIKNNRDEQVVLPVDIQFLIAFPGQRSVLMQLKDGTIQKWSLINRHGFLRFEPLYSSQKIANIQAVNFHDVENAALLHTFESELVFLNHVTGEVVNSHQHNMHIVGSSLVNQLLYLADTEKIQVGHIDAIQAINTFQSFWGENQYEGYRADDYVWQTTSASDFHEAKFSIVPLVMGSLKASFLALLIAVPLALSAAVYTAYFAPSKLRNWMKPSIEILEAIPSVVLGFIAAIWLAPLAEQFIISLVLFVIFIPLVLLIFTLIHQPLLNVLPQRFKEGWELPIIAILLLLDAGLVSFITSAAAANTSGILADSLLPSEVFANLNKSTLVVALALGIAVVPSIYSLAEDAIFEVPTSLKQASLALGATRLQTLRKVVLVLAYPGILSAVALGLGRAFGETMIVLMVTGNTPVADWNLLSGLRTLTANLAIELPESEVSSSHYQVLFLTALVLFAFTFLLNTLAELLRQWLRKNYRHG